MNEGKAARFHRLRRRSRRLQFAARAGVVLAAIGWGHPLERVEAAMAVAALPDGLAVVLGAGLFAAAIGCAAELLALPFVFHADLLLERRFGLSRQSVGGWLLGHAQATAMRVVGWSVGASAVCAAIAVWPTDWWKVAGAGFLVMSVAQAGLASTMLARHTRPLARRTLRARLEALLRRAGAPSVAVHEWRVGATSDAANAAVVGIGPSRCILVSDTLLEDYSDEEIEAVIAHEIGHHVHADMWQAILCASAVALGAFWTAATVLPAALAAFPLLGVGVLGEVASVPLLALTYGAVTTAASPIVNLLSRWQERRADHYALRMTGNPDAFVSGLRRVSAQYLAEECPPRLVEWFSHSHPSPAARIARARAVAAKG